MIILWSRWSEIVADASTFNTRSRFSSCQHWVQVCWIATSSVCHLYSLQSCEWHLVVWDRDLDIATRPRCSFRLRPRPRHCHKTKMFISRLRPRPSHCHETKMFISSETETSTLPQDQDVHFTPETETSILPRDQDVHFTSETETFTLPQDQDVHFTSETETSILPRDQDVRFTSETETSTLPRDQDVHFTSETETLQGRNRDLFQTQLLTIFTYMWFSLRTNATATLQVFYYLSIAHENHNSWNVRLILGNLTFYKIHGHVYNYEYSHFFWLSHSIAKFFIAW